MILNDVLEKCSQMTINQTRSTSDEYVELVFYTKDLVAWDQILTDTLGSPVKTPKQKAEKDDSRITEQFGGVWAGQTLFKKDNEDSTIIAMLWPWGDNVHTTLKLALLAIQTDRIT